MRSCLSAMARVVHTFIDAKLYLCKGKLKSCRSFRFFCKMKANAKCECGMCAGIEITWTFVNSWIFRGHKTMGDKTIEKGYCSDNQLPLMIFVKRGQYQGCKLKSLLKRCCLHMYLCFVIVCFYFLWLLMKTEVCLLIGVNRCEVKNVMITEQKNTKWLPVYICSVLKSLKSPKRHCMRTTHLSKNYALI